MTAKYYSSLYDTTVNQGTTLYTPRQPMVITRGVPFVEYFTFTLLTTTVLGVGDIIYLLPTLPSGFKLTRYCMTSPDYDSGTTLQFNLGYLSQDLTTVSIFSANSTAFQAAATTSATDAQLIAAGTASGPVAATTNFLVQGSSDALAIYVTAAATGAGGGTTTKIIVEGILP